MFIRTAVILASVALAAPAVYAQQQGAMTMSHDSKGPVLSPRDTTRATVGSASVLVDYGRPSKRNREIFGGLVPYDQVWRTGANAATTLVTDKALTIGTTDVPAGTYTLYTLPTKTGWTLIVNKETGQWGTVYHQDKDFARIPMTVAALSAPVEKFEIAVAGGQLHLKWDTTDASVAIAEKK